MSSQKLSHDSTMQNEEAPIKQPKLLQTLGHGILKLAHYAVKKAVELPKPFGSTIAMVEEVIGPRVQPIVRIVESQSLHLLSFVDNQLYAVGGVIEKCLNVVGSHKQVISSFEAAAGKIRRRGLIGSAADLWVDCGYSVQRRSEKVVHLMHKVPGFSLVSPVVCGVGAYAYDTIWTWLRELSEAEEKQVLPLDDEKQNEALPADMETDIDSDDSNEHAYVEAKVASEDDMDEAVIVESPQHAFVKEKVDDNGEDLKKQPDEDEQDEVTKMFDAGWSLGTL